MATSSRIVATIAVAKELFIRRLEHGMTEDEIIEASPSPEQTARARNRPYKVIAAMGPISILLWVFLGEGFFEGFLVGLAISWVAFMGWVFVTTTCGRGIRSGSDGLRLRCFPYLSFSFT